MADLRFGPPPPRKLEVRPSDDDVAFFRENGFLAVDRLTTDEELEWLTKIFDAVMDDPRAGTFEPGRNAGDEGPVQLSQTMFPELLFPEILESTYRHNGRRFAAALLGLPEDDLTCWGHMIRKPPISSRAAPWHQDEAYWPPEFSYTAIAAWLPLHDVTVERGCMQFIPGSHKGPVLTHGHVGDPAANLIEAQGVDVSKAVACELPAGGATFHHPRTLHFTAPNTTDLPRLAFPMEFQLSPVRKEAQGEPRPWVAAYRSATGATAPATHVADGKVVPLPAEPPVPSAT